MPVEEALQLATLKNADLLDQSDQLGQLKPCYLADIIATDESTNKNISTLTNVTFVMKDWVVYKN